VDHREPRGLVVHSFRGLSVVAEHEASLKELNVAKCGTIYTEILTQSNGMKDD